MKHAKLLPPRTFVARTKAGQRYYIYCDPDYCKCVFVGDETAMNRRAEIASVFRALNTVPF